MCKGLEQSKGFQGSGNRELWGSVQGKSKGSANGMIKGLRDDGNATFLCLMVSRHELSSR